MGNSPYAEVAAGANSLLAATRDRLRLWDIDDTQIHKLEETGKAERTLTLYSPINGFVMSRNAYEQSYVTPETELYEISDFSTIWVYVDIYEYEAPYVHMGQPASMQLTYFPGKTCRGLSLIFIQPLIRRREPLKSAWNFPTRGSKAQHVRRCGTEN